MSKYTIAWMPGDGVGKDVMDAARIVLDAMKFDAEYIPADIGWDFWCHEGDALPQRTVDILKRTDCGLFGAITSKPNDEAQQELDDRLKGKGLPKAGGAGDLFVITRIILPDGNDAELEALMEKWRDGHPYNPRSDFG
jgi:hypothetical protein